MTSESEVRDTLNGITDPCSAVAGAPAGLVEMGLVRSVSVEPGPDGAFVKVTLGVTEPTCLMSSVFYNEAQKRLAALPGVAGVEVGFDHALRWTPSEMSPEYRERLEAHRAKRRALRAARRAEATPRSRGG